ncbi:AAA family ATPase [Kitasatospora sp. NPDC058184]|uniref:AAA family ATPase n=1 Tax=Kitasatospora sp. NPDC058184 TaxID=3346370 RepID=UPI0036DCF66F
MTKAEVEAMAKARPGWRPDKLREQREAHGLTLEQAGDKLRGVATTARLKDVPAANPQTLWQHEQGEVYPGVAYQRAYCLMYGAADWELGFRNPLPSDEPRKLGLTPSTDQHTGAHALAVERALLQIAPGTTSADHLGIQQRIMDAWRRRHTGGDPHRPTLVLVGGYAGSGKTEFARFLSEISGWPLLDKDPMCRPLVESLLTALGSDRNDRHTETYVSKVRPLEYESLLAAANANIDCGISSIVTAPLVAELRDEGWMRRLQSRCDARKVKVAPVWVKCDVESMRDYIGHRSAARDTWKLDNWEQYVAGLDMDLRPVVPHLVVDNRFGAAVAMADQARLALGSVRR